MYKDILFPRWSARVLSGFVVNKSRLVPRALLARRVDNRDPSLWLPVHPVPPPTFRHSFIGAALGDRRITGWRERGLPALAAKKAMITETRLEGTTGGIQSLS